MFPSSVPLLFEKAITEELELPIAKVIPPLLLPSMTNSSKVASTLLPLSPVLMCKPLPKSFADKPLLAKKVSAVDPF